jgi:hypothetical protein
LIKHSRKYHITFFLCVIVFLFIFRNETKAQEDVNYIAFSAAVFDVLQQNNAAFEGRVEFQLNKIDWAVKPFSGLMTNTDGAVHIYTGIFIELPLTSFLFIKPSFAPGLYYHNNSKDLNFVLEFRSQFEIGLKLEDGIKFGVSFNHISNASLGSTNPGVESIAISYYFPIY